MSREAYKCSLWVHRGKWRKMGRTTAWGRVVGTAVGMIMKPWQLGQR